MKKKNFFWLLVVLLIVLAKFAIGKLIVYSCLSRYLSLEQIKVYGFAFKNFVEMHYVSSVVFYILSYALSIMVGLPAVAPMSLLGGFLFGIFWGMIFGAMGATLGSCCAFIIFRYVIRSWVRKRYSHQLVRFNDQMNRYGAYYLLMVHFASVIPFFFINSLAALADISWWTFAWTTVVGFIPLALVYSFAGEKLGTIESVSDIMTPQIIAVFILLFIFAFVPVVIKHYREIK